MASMAERIASLKAKKATSPTTGSSNTIVPFKLKLGDNFLRIIPLHDSDIAYNKDVLQSSSDMFMKIREWATGEFTSYGKPTRHKGLPYNGKKYPFTPVGDKIQETKSKLWSDSVKRGNEYAIALKQYNEAKASDDLTTFELQELRDKVDFLKEMQNELKASSDRFYCDEKPRVYFLVIDRESGDIKYYSLSSPQYATLESAIDDGVLTNAKTALLDSFMDFDNIRKLDKASVAKVKQQLKKDLNEIKSLDDFATFEEDFQPLLDNYEIPAEDVAEMFANVCDCLDAHDIIKGFDINIRGVDAVMKMTGKSYIGIDSIKLNDISTPAFDSSVIGDVEDFDKDKKAKLYKDAPVIMGDVFRVLTPEFVESALEKMFDIPSETKSSSKPVVTESKPSVKKEVTEPIPAKAKLTREVEEDFEEDEEIDDLPY